VATRLFLQLNGHDLAVDEAERVEVWVALGAGEIAENALAQWLRRHIVKL
jgi:prophage maintenance system killer protein